MSLDYGQKEDQKDQQGAAISYQERQVQGHEHAAIWVIHIGDPERSMPEVAWRSYGRPGSKDPKLD